MSAPALGFYGKLPSRGDFLRVSLSRSFAETWDSWLQAVLPAAQVRLGDLWPEAWWRTRPWRFTSAGEGDRPSMTGVWLPSADRAGRHFPLVIASEACIAVGCLDMAEAEGRTAVSGDIDPEELTARLRRCSPLHGDMTGGGMTWRRQQFGEVTDAFETPDWPSPDLFVEMLRP